MAWVEVEEDGKSWVVVIAGIVALASGVVIWWYHDFCNGFFAYFGFGFGIMLVHSLWSQIRLPWQARRAANIVLAWFRDQHPKERVESVAVRAIEPDRYIIAVRHGFGKPTPRSYFAIGRPELTEIAELPESEWWPRGLK